MSEDKTVKLRIPITPELRAAVEVLDTSKPPGAAVAEVAITPSTAWGIVEHIQQQRFAPSYATARQSLLHVITYGPVGDRKTAARALKLLERAEDIRIDRDTPSAFIEHAKRLMDVSDGHNIVELARQAVDEWEDVDEDD